MVVVEDFARFLVVLSVRLEKHHAAPLIYNSTLSNKAKLLMRNSIAVGRNEMRWVHDNLIHALLLLMAIQHFLLLFVGCVLQDGLE